MVAKNKEFSLVNIPPKGHKDVGKWAWNLFEIAKSAKEDLMLPDRWRENYKLYRGDHWQNKGKKDKKKVTVNLYFANIERTKANLTAQEPIAEVVDSLGDNDGAAAAFTSKTKKWWSDTRQQRKLNTSILKMEKYGITVEKGAFNTTQQKPDITVCDPYSFFPAPGNYEDIGLECPYICNAYPESVDAAEALFNVSGLEADDTYSLLQDTRSEVRPVPSGLGDSAKYSGTYNDIEQKGEEAAGTILGMVLIVEVWVRDNSTETIETPIVDEGGEPIVDENGDQLIKSITQPKYPGGIRVITLTGSGRTKSGEKLDPIVLEDIKNPNINHELSIDLIRNTYFYNRLPFWKANSYEDSTTLWGFSASEQVGPLLYKIDTLFSRLIAYAERAMYPTLIIPKDSGVTAEMVNNEPSLVLWPTSTMHSQGIRYLPVPNLPATFFNILDLIVRFFDRTYQIEDADRGVAPKGVVAASAIVALQERNATLLQHKKEAVDYLVEERGKCYLALSQNFDFNTEPVDVNGEAVMMRPSDYVGRDFGYIVESGSTLPKTSLQVAAQSEKYFSMGAIDRQALLENTGYPGWKQVIERVGEGQLGQALQILVQAGLPEEAAMELQQMLMEAQGGPGTGKNKDGTKAVAAGTPRSGQGEMPPDHVEREE